MKGIAGVLLGLDHGTKRIGMAVSDKNQDFVWILPIIESRLFKEKLLEIIIERGVSGIVVGWPLMLNGEVGEQCKVVESFISEIHEIWAGPIFTHDERMTNSMSRSLYFSSSDSVAAVSILETFIARRLYG